MKIDLNADMGEGFGPWRIADDEALMRVVTSANIACGFHAGDHALMDRMVRLAKANGVGIGAHPGLPDMMGFGRRPMAVSADELLSMLAYQIGALRGIAALHEVRVTHVSFHAVLGNLVNADDDIADRVCATIRALDPTLTVFAMQGQPMVRAAAAHGLPVTTLFLADRAYQADGNLVPRGRLGAVIHDEAVLRARVRRFLSDACVVAIDGERLALSARSILVHSDTPGSLALAGIVRDEIVSSGAVPTPQHLFA